MWKFTGNISGTVDSLSQNLPMVIQNFTLVNMTGGAVVCNVYLIQGSRNVQIMPNNKSIDANGIYTDDIPRTLEIGETIRLATSGNVSYLFNLENTFAP